jgi:8-oxo-dGTP pyrophosphatase MutT (NUDIX family)
VGGRLLLLDPQGRVLLIHERIEHGTHWLTPGGGVEPGELPVRAAVRETWEETGIAVDLYDDAQPVLVTQRLWSWRGVTYDQADHFYLARVDGNAVPRPRALTKMEHETLIGHRWWTSAELRVTRDIVLPADLAAVLDRVAPPAA